MIVPSLIALMVAAQVSGVTPPDPASGSVVVGAEVTIRPSAVAVDRATLDELVSLLIDPKLAADMQEARYEALVRAGRLLELAGPTRAIVHEVAHDGKYGNRTTGVPVDIGTGLILDGPHARRRVVFLAAQVELTPGPVSIPRHVATPAEQAQAAAARASASARAARIYREYKTGKNAAKARAGAVDVSVRRQIERRGLDALRSGLLKKYKLASPGELDAIIAWGEALDGTADRRIAENRAGRAEAQARNDAQMEVFDRAIAASLSQVLRDAARADAVAAECIRRFTSVPGPFYLPIDLSHRERGREWDHIVPDPIRSSTRGR